MSDDEGGPSGKTADDDIGLPKSTVAKFIAEFMPEGMTCVKDARDLVTDCCKEFVVLLASEANEICEKQSKKTIGTEHIIEALKSLGFDKYITEVESVTETHKAATKRKERTKKTADRFKHQLNKTAEELEQEQEALLSNARSRLEHGGAPVASTSGTA